MFTRFVLFILVALGGAGLAIQMAWNARLRASIGSPVLTTIVSVFVTLLSLTLVWVSGATPRGSIPIFNSLPQWAWFGGIFAAYYLVASLIAILLIKAYKIKCWVPQSLHPTYKYSRAEQYRKRCNLMRNNICKNDFTEPLIN